MRLDTENRASRNPHIQYFGTIMHSEPNKHEKNQYNMRQYSDGTSSCLLTLLH